MWNHDITAAPRGEEKKTVVQILKDARALIADEKNWTQGQFATTEDGDPTPCSDSNATCFCSIGAIARVVGLNPMETLPGESFLDEEAFKMGENNVPEFNDHRTHAEVLALFDRAIARAENEVA